jgi:hypothetical protein
MIGTINGGCLCEKIRYTIKIDELIEEIHAEYCHCTMCRKSSGSVMASLFTIPKKSITFNKIPNKYESSKNIYRSFCSNCGSQISWENINEDKIDIGIGTLDEPDKIKPKIHVWVENKILIINEIPKYLKSSKGELLKN